MLQKVGCWTPKYRPQTAGTILGWCFYFGEGVFSKHGVGVANPLVEGHSYFFDDVHDVRVRPRIHHQF